MSKQVLACMIAGRGRWCVRVGDSKSAASDGPPAFRSGRFRSVRRRWWWPFWTYYGEPFDGFDVSGMVITPPAPVPRPVPAEPPLVVPGAAP